jgi:hypothetical protein
MCGCEARVLESRIATRPSFFGLDLKVTHFLMFSIDKFCCIYVIYKVYGTINVKRGKKNEVSGQFFVIKKKEKEKRNCIAV